MWGRTQENNPKTRAPGAFLTVWGAVRYRAACKIQLFRRIKRAVKNQLQVGIMKVPAAGRVFREAR